MFRSVSAFALAALLTAPAVAADYNDDYGMRPAYPDTWEEENSISIELGLRYWYSRGQHNMTVVGDSYSSQDTSHIGETHFRIEDSLTRTYLEGNLGLSGVTNGTYNTPGSGGLETQMSGGRIYYTGLDFGYTPFGSEGTSFGGFAGYQYWNDSPDMGRINYGVNSEVNNIEYHMLKLGVSGKAQLTDQIDITAELAAVPFAALRGTYGAFDSPIAPQESPGRISGWLYGATGEVMLGYHPTDNLVIRGGARAWYLTGPAKMDWQAGGGGLVSNTATYSTARYGLLAEISMKF